jgi:hypothetical protein
MALNNTYRLPDTDEPNDQLHDISLAEVHRKLKELPHYDFIQLMQKLCEDKNDR